MNFKKRLLYYLLGFGLGIFVVFAFILRNKKLDFWTPSEMIKSRLAEKPFLLSKKAECQMKCLKIYPDYVMMKVKNATVVFEPGKMIKERCKTYTLKHQQTEMVFEICPTDVKLIELNQGMDTCKCK